MEYIGRAERARFMSKRVIFQPFKAYKKSFYALFWIEDKSIFSLCDRCGLCGETIAFLQWSQRQITVERISPIPVVPVVLSL